MLIIIIIIDSSSGSSSAAAAAAAAEHMVVSRLCGYKIIFHNFNSDFQYESLLSLFPRRKKKKKKKKEDGVAIDRFT
jgi:hypothetical protein